VLINSKLYHNASQASLVQALRVNKIILTASLGYGIIASDPSTRGLSSGGSEMELRTCVVCGAASHRSDWINKLGNEVACDHHTKEEVAKAVALKAQASKAVAPAAPAAPATKGVPIPPKK
jgi:hypothetical protein